MNQFVHDWSNMGDNSRPLGEDDDLIELLWCNGHVVMQNQTNRKLPPRPEKPPGPTPTTLTAAAPVAAPTQEDEAGVWFPFALADSLDNNKDIFSDLFCEPPPPPPPAVTGKPCCTEDVPPEEEEGGGGACGLMPPPKSTHHLSCCSRQQTTISIGGDDDLSELVRAAGRGRKKAEASSSMLSVSVSAIGSSICGSNQVVVPRGTPDTALPSAVGSANAIENADGRGKGRDRDRAGGGHEATVASSSGRSNGRFGAATTTEEPTSTTSNRSSKRKRLDTEEEDAQSPSEDAESESAAAAAAACEPPPKLTTARRSRAAEVHNLSERRRRDRINEKMRALQELIPHCTKVLLTDKASMLDEAIEYLKSLQMQVQMMWMGSGISAPPVMFPSVHQYLPRMGVGTMPRMPPFMASQPPVNPVPLSAAVGITEPYAHYLGVNHLQPTPTQHFVQGVSYYPQQNPAALHMPASGTAAAPDLKALQTQDQGNCNEKKSRSFAWLRWRAR